MVVLLILDIMAGVGQITYRECQGTRVCIQHPLHLRCRPSPGGKIQDSVLIPGSNQSERPCSRRIELGIEYPVYRTTEIAQQQRRSGNRRKALEQSLAD